MGRGGPETLPLSAGAERVVSAARSAAGECEVTSRCILHALWEDESRAADVLRAAGFDAESVARSEDASGQDDVLSAVLRVARRTAITAGEGEIGTEHLLTAVLELDPEVREFLSDDFDQLIAPNRPEAPLEEPLEFDEELCVEVSAASNRPATTHHSPPTTHHSATQRLLDAAANRGREGLRVVEDFVRFRLNDAHLSSALKNLRHDLKDALSQLGADEWHRHRDTPGDVGTEVGTPHEYERASPDDVLRANCKRVAESLRSLEEFGKLMDAGAAAAIEQIRYRFYTIEKAVLTTISSRARLETCRLYLLAGERDCPQGFERTIREAVAGGVDIVQLREKGGDDAQLLRRARQAREWTRAAGALLIVNDRPDVAVLADADGVHVGQEDLSCREARRIVGGERLVGVSTHSIEQARQAVLEGADYLGVGPVFPSETKEFANLAGPEFVREVAVEISLPWFAIGGISESNMPDLLAAGASRVAVSRAICGANEIRTAAEALSAALSGPS